VPRTTRGTTARLLALAAPRTHQGRDVPSLTASNPAAGLWSLQFKDKLRVLRTLALAQLQAHQAIKPYQQLRYWSTVPFGHGPIDVVKHSATPSPDNPARPLQRSNPNGLQDELIRHLEEGGKMSSFDFGLQLLDADRMTYWGKRQDANFWIENASVEWNEAEAPFHTVARLTLLPKSQLGGMPPKRHTSTSPGTRPLTVRPSGALIAPGIPRRLPAEKHVWPRPPVSEPGGPRCGTYFIKFDEPEHEREENIMNSQTDIVRPQDRPTLIRIAQRQRMSTFKRGTGGSIGPRFCSPR
jgi:hypothetical protein